MFLSIMSAFHEKLPCAKFYFRQRRLFKEKFMKKMYPNGFEGKASSSKFSSELRKFEG